MSANVFLSNLRSCELMVAGATGELERAKAFDGAILQLSVPAVSLRAILHLRPRPAAFEN
jgi:hypothetical protein